jgi:serine/threonine protein kinase
MVEVYRARDAKLNREVAIKVLPAALANDADYLARFQREVQTLAALHHPNTDHSSVIRSIGQRQPRKR